MCSYGCVIPLMFVFPYVCDDSLFMCLYVCVIHYCMCSCFCDLPLCNCVIPFYCVRTSIVFIRVRDSLCVCVCGQSVVVF